MTTDSASASYAISFTELVSDSVRARATLQLNEDKIEEFNKWSEGTVRLVKTILEEAARLTQLLPNLDAQISKFVSFEHAFGVGKSVEVLDTVSNLLKNTQSSNCTLVKNITAKILTPLQAYFLEDFRELKDSRKSFDKVIERYDSVLFRHFGLSKFKDVSTLDSDLVQLYDTRVSYFESCLDHAARINNFKEMTMLIDELSEFFQRLAENFDSVKLQMDKVRGEFDRLNRQSAENRAANETAKTEHIQKVRERWNPEATIVRPLVAEKVGHLFLKRRKTLGSPWRRVYASIVDGTFSYEIPGRIRGTMERHGHLNVLLCEIRPVDLGERRFCFEIYTGQQSQIFQAESEDDMMDWINTFHASKGETLAKSKSTATSPTMDAAPPPAPLETEPVARKFEYGGHIALKKWNEELHRHFDTLLDGEVTLCSSRVPASLHTDIWTQGRVFVTQYSVYFYTSLFGIGTKMIIPLKDIMKVDVVPTNFVTLVNFSLSGESKDVTLRTFNTADDSTDQFMERLQLLHRNTQSAEPQGAASLFAEMQQKATEETEETPEPLYESTDNIISTLAAPQPSAGTEPATPVLAIDRDDRKEISCGCSSHMDKRQVNTVIPIDCTIAFNLMFGPECPVQHAVQTKRNNRNYKISEWKANAEGVEERHESYLFPINNPLVRIKETECYVTMRLSKSVPGKYIRVSRRIMSIYACRSYVVDCEAHTPNIMYADAFYTKTRYCITRAGPDQTRISICLGIVWLKSPFVKSIIKSATLKTFTEFCFDYMKCLRQEIAVRIGSGPVAPGGRELSTADMLLDEGDARLRRSTSLESSASKTTSRATSKRRASENGFMRMGHHALDALTFLMRQGTRTLHDFPLFVLLAGAILSFALGYAVRPRTVVSVVSSYDLESEVVRSMNLPSALRAPRPADRRVWMSRKFEQSFLRLNRLHDEFVDIRQAIWTTLQRLADLERRIYQAETVASLGDRLLVCLESEHARPTGKGAANCNALQSEWRQALTG